MDINSEIERIESIPPGSWELSIYGSSSIWGDKNNVKRLKDMLSRIFNEISEKFVFVNILRKVVITPTIKEEADNYERLLGRPVANYQNKEEGSYGGITLIWGDGKELQSTYGIVLWLEGAARMSLDNEEWVSTFAHELGHLCEDVILKNILGDKKLYYRTNDWNGIKQHFARSIFGEFFAEAIATPYHSKENIKSCIELGVTTLNNVTMRLQKNVEEFRDHQEIDHLWRIALEEMSWLYNQFGRSLGVIWKLRDENSDLWDYLFASIKNSNPIWIPLLKDLMEELTRIMEKDWDETLLNEIIEIVEEGFYNVGLITQLDDEGKLRIKVL